MCTRMSSTFGKLKEKVTLIYYSNAIWHADKQYHCDKNDPKLESCRHLMIFTQFKKERNSNVKSYQISVDHKSYILK